MRRNSYTTSARRIALQGRAASSILNETCRARPAARALLTTASSTCRSRGRGPTAARKPPVHLKEPDELARTMVARSYRLDVSSKLRVPLTLFLERAVMERLHERAIKDGTSVAAMVEDLIRREASR